MSDRRPAPVASRPWRLALTVLALAALVACSSKEEQAAKSLRKGADYLQHAEYDKVGVEVRNVLQIDPKNAPAFLLAAQTDEARGNLRGAFANYSKVLEIQPGQTDSQLSLARLYLLANEGDKATALILEVLGREPGNARAQTLQVALIARSGHPEEALTAARRVLGSGSELSVDSSQLLAGLMVNQKLIDEALTILDRAMQAHPQDPRLPQMAAEAAAAAAGDEPLLLRADGYWQKATALAPARTGLWKAWSLMYVRRGRIDQAEQVLKKAQQQSPDDAERVLARLELSSAFRDPTRVEAEFKVAADDKPRMFAVRMAWAEWLRQQKRNDEAVTVLQAVADREGDAPAGLEARGRIASIKLQAGQVDVARDTVTALLKANPRDVVGLGLRARLLLLQGRAQDAILDLRAVSRDKPGEPEIVQLLSMAHLVAGEPQLAREALVDAVKARPDNPLLHVMLAQDMLHTRELLPAASACEDALRLAPRLLDALVLRGRIALAQGKADAVDKAAAALDTAVPKSPAGDLLRGQWAAQNKNQAGALQAYDRAIARAPGDAEPVGFAVGLLVPQNRMDEAQKRVDALLKARPDSLTGLELKAELALARRDLPAAEQGFRDLAARPQAPVTVWRNLAVVVAAKGDLPGTLAVLTQAERAHPEDGQFALMRAEWLMKAGKLEEGIAVYEARLKKSPSDDMAANNLAFVLASQKQDAASLARAGELAERFAASPNPGYLDTLGLVRYRLKQYPQAAQVLEKALQARPGDAGTQLHYGMALVQQGELQKGRELLRKALAANGKLPEAQEARGLLDRG